MLWVTSRRSGSAVVVSAGGEVDASNEAKWDRLVSETAAAATAPGPVVVDVRQLDFMGCCAFTVLARKAEGCRRRGVSLCLVSHQPIVARIVAAGGLRPLLPIYPTTEMAMTRVAAGLSGR